MIRRFFSIRFASRDINIEATVLDGMKKPSNGPILAMDRAYEDDSARQLASTSDSYPSFFRRETVLPLGRTTASCTSGATNNERLLRRLQGFRRIFSRFEKLDVVFLGFVVFALIVDALL